MVVIFSEKFLEEVKRQKARDNRRCPNRRDADCCMTCKFSHEEYPYDFRPCSKLRGPVSDTEVCDNFTRRKED
jgi:hypothetical protein